LAAGFFIGAFFFAVVFFAAALAIVFPSVFFAIGPNQFRNEVIMSKRSYFVDSEQRIQRGSSELCRRCVASSPQKSGFRFQGSDFQGDPRQIS
jgi:hypothetical protein